MLASGSLRILDLVMMQRAWELPSVKRLVARGAQEKREADQNRQQRRAQRSDGNNEAANAIALTFDMLRLMPHGLQGTLRSPPHQIWSAMRAEGFITQPSDLLLNHGIDLTGIWSLVGILDATPKRTDRRQLELPVVLPHGNRLPGCLSQNVTALILIPIVLLLANKVRSAA